MAKRFQIETIFKGVDRVSAPITRMEQRVTRFTRNVSRRLRSMAAVTDRWRAGLSRGLMIGTAALTASVYLLTRQINDYAASADSLAKRSRRLQFPIEELQEWNFVAQQAGFGSAEFDKALEGLAKRMGEMRAGSGSLYTYLQRTDRQLLRTLSNTSDMSEAVDIMVAALQRQPDAMARAALASAAFGRQGLKFANVSELGAEAIARLRAEMRANGLITEQNANNAEAYNDSMNSLRLGLLGVRNEALAPLIPMLKDMADNTREIVNANRDLIATKVNEYITYLVENFDDLLDRAKQIAMALGIFMLLSSIIRTLAAAVTLLGGAIRALSIAWIILNAVMVNSPIGRALGIITGAVAVLVYRLDDLIDRFKYLKENMGFRGLNRFFFSDTDRIAQGEATRPFDRIRRFFGDSGEDDSATSASDGDANEGPSLLERITAPRGESTTTERSEVIIRDETGRAEFRGQRPTGPGIRLERGGDFR